MSAELRVMVMPAWDTIATAYSADQTVGSLKRDALEQARVMVDPVEFAVKYQGAEVEDTLSVAAAGVPVGAAVIVLRRRRLPVR